MNRNDRYPRRGMPSCRGTRPVAAPAADERDHCLCDGQPIALAMAYVKDQPFGALYSPAEALRYGTLFPELNKPYCIGGRMR